jgi:DNA invertase Pin-like site-specific DNA recombinase
MPRAERSRHVAQYLRMSTDHQRYSLENQAAAIAEYAAIRDFEVVKTYKDAAKSGVTIKGRDGLKRLLSDVLGGAPGYSKILVFDVSRWGRFQDPDQAAHYEFVCREAGIAIEYCAEPFDNDGTSSSSIMKHLKRVMAAEFSRELSQKARAAQIRAARRGCKQGGSAPFGLRRQLIDENGQAVMLLKPGQRKALGADHVVFVPGPPAELKTVCDIFRWYALRRFSLPEILRALERENRPAPETSAWTIPRIKCLLRNEKYLGIYLFNKTRQHLGSNPVPNPPEEWVRVRMFPTIVSPSIFKAAAKRTESQRRHHYTDAEMLKRLGKLRALHGTLSTKLINSSPTTPSAHSYRRRFGSTRRACELVGHFGPVNFNLRDDNGRRTSEGALLAGLRRLLEAHGYLSIALIDADPDLPSTMVFRDRFGTMERAYNLAGWQVNHGDLVSSGKRRVRGPGATAEALSPAAG